MSNNSIREQLQALELSSSQLESVYDPGFDVGVSDEAVDEREHDETIYMVILVWTIVIMFTGCFGNILVISAVLLHRDLRRIENVFIANLAVADMGVSLIVNSFCIVGILTKSEFFIGKEWLCEVIGVICITCCTCSMWSIAAIGVNRYVVICHWSSYHNVYNKRTVPVMLLAMWIICFLIDLPNIIGWGGHQFDWKTMVCTADMAIDYSYTVYFVSMGFGLPLCFIIYSYIRIYYHAWRSSARLSRVAKEDGMSPRRSNDMKLARSVLIIVIVFISMWTPYAFTVIIDRDSVAHRYIYIFSALLAHTNSSINCVIYVATNRNFRQGYVYFFRFISCRGSVSPSMITLSRKSISASQKTIFIDDQV